MALSCALAIAEPHVIQSLVDAVNRAPITQAPINLLVSVGAMVCKITTSALGAASYFHLVVSDMATADCEQDVEQTFREEGLTGWRDSVIETIHMARPNLHFPGSTESTLYVIHPEVPR
ncbi:hypothetical protein LKL35_29490 [Streptomyces sp. ET3-23]|uniref:hypothetical protein n=1 Tax=Streptomyces sp. ET3-23 TaxID=2885643 RepID=UPI001D0F916B|nr:hypothetical protein [Streptomyces sp. ET3-23]MCC2279533.1 hypothetical protein [Streptomyces sp. ET3-23]